jgi:hypothetical protein
MNKPEPINIPPQPIITKRLLAQIASKAIAEAAGQFTANDIFERVKATAVSANWRTLLDQTCWSITKTAIDNHTSPKLQSNDDWIGYGETVIKLIDGKLVKVKHATINDLDVRANNVKDNLIKIKQAAENELARIKEIQGVMRSKNLKFAGDALGYLEGGEKAA